MGFALVDRLGLGSGHVVYTLSFPVGEFGICWSLFWGLVIVGFVWTRWGFCFD